MNFSQTTLPNGIRVITDRVDTVETVTLGVWVNVGSRNEDEEVSGVSHFLEHMAFKGTARRTALDIAVEIENVGGQLNAYTSRDTTVYYATVLKENVDLAVDIIADILIHSKLDEEELNRERAVILQEISQVRDTPDDIVFDHFQQAAYPDQPLGRPVLGSAETVRHMSREGLLSYVNAEYGADRMILSAAGNIEHNYLVDLANKTLTNLKQHSGKKVGTGIYSGGDFREFKALEQLHLVIGFEAAGYLDDQYYPLGVLSTALGGGMSSRFFQEVREKRGLAYSVYTFTSPYDDGGLFGIYAGTSAEQSEKLIDVVCEELRRVAEKPLHKDEIARAKTQIKAGVLMSLENTASRAERISRQLLIYGHVITADEMSKKIDQVTEEEIRVVAEGLLKSTPTLSAVGPVNSLPSYEKITQCLAM
ncbi:MAG: pitrilysin family protein [Pseudomonadota bacterium]|nr:pitrilysin family protein [Pseudomonadota bacterium]